MVAIDFLYWLLYGGTESLLIKAAPPICVATSKSPVTTESLTEEFTRIISKILHDYARNVYLFIEHSVRHLTAISRNK